MINVFTSPLANDIRAFIEFKHATGVAFTDGEHIMRKFDHYAASTGSTSLTRNTVEGFISVFESGKPHPNRHYLSYLRGFAVFCQACGHQDAHVVSPVFTSHQPRPATYLLDQTQIDAFFETAAMFKAADPWGWQATAFFGLMLTCGLRTCEAYKLNRSEVHLNEGVIDVLWSKGPRSRRLPISNEVAAMLAACDHQNTVFAPGRTRFFISTRGGPVNSSTPSRVFHRIWQTTQLPVPASKPKPVPYAFRHHFAYANIERWAANGIDPLTKLPYLARYMGHADVASTYYYLALSPDYAATYANTAHTSQMLIPEIEDA